MSLTPTGAEYKAVSEDDPPEASPPFAGDQATARASRRLVLCVSLALSFCMYVALSMVAAFFPRYVKRWNLSSDVLGFIMACYPLGTFLCSPAAGWLCGAIGRLWTVISGLAVCTATSLLTGFTASFFPDHPVPCFVASRLVQGAACCLVETALLAMLVDLYPKRELGRVMSWYETVNGIGYMVGPTLGGALYDATSFKWPFVTTAAAFGVLGLVIVGWQCASEPVVALAEEERRGSWTQMINPRLCLAGCAAWTMAASFGISEPTLSGHLDDYLNLTSTAYVGLMFSIPSLSYMTACFAAAMAAERYGDEQTIIAGLVVIAVALAVLGPMPGLLELLSPLWSKWLCTVGALILYGVGAALAVIPVLAALSSAVVHVRMEESTKSNTVSAVYQFVYAAGACCGPLLGGLGVELTSFSSFMTMAAAVVLGVAALYATVLARSGASESPSTTPKGASEYLYCANSLYFPETCQDFKN